MLLLSYVQAVPRQEISTLPNPSVEALALNLCKNHTVDFQLRLNHGVAAQ